jgi:hypothetical protein
MQVGVGIREDVRRIAADYGVITRSAVDLADVARAVALQLLLSQQPQGTAAAAAVARSAAGSSRSSGATSLAGLCRLLLGVEVDKTLQVGMRQTPTSASICRSAQQLLAKSNLESLYPRCWALKLTTRCRWVGGNRNIFGQHLLHHAT